nr:glycosyltransferase family 2 protein [Salella cibi]
MPTLNEEEGIGSCIDAIVTMLNTAQIPGEIIVSDSSTDATPEIAREKGAKVVKPDKGGYGYAYQFGFKHARGEYIAMGDADTTYDFGDLPRLLEPVQRGDADMCMGSRLDGEIKPGAMPPLHQYIGNPLLTKFLNMFYSAGVSDAHSGMRVFTRDAWERMNCTSTGMEFASEMIMEAGAKDLKIAEKPIVYHEREGEETLDSFQDGWRHVRFMLVNAPGYLFSAPGIGLMLLGTILLGVVGGGVSIGNATFGARTAIAGSLFVITGINVASYGIYATVVSDPIRRPDDPVTDFITETMTLESGLVAGSVTLGLGGAYALLAVTEWSISGFSIVPSLAESMLAFTAIVVGVQIIFGSFFLSLLSNKQA